MAVSCYESGEENAGVGVSMLWILQGAGCAVAEIPVPTRDGIAQAVNIGGIKLNRQRWQAVGRTGGKLNGRMGHNHIGHSNDRAKANHRDTTGIGGDEIGVKCSGVGIVVRRILGDAGCAVTEIPIPTGDGIAKAVNICRVKLDGQRRRAANRIGGKLDGWIGHDYSEEEIPGFLRLQGVCSECGRCMIQSSQKAIPG